MAGMGGRVRFKRIAVKIGGVMDKMESFIKNSGLRKFGLAFCWIVSTGYLLHAGVLPAENYMEIQKVLIVGIFGANVIEHFTKKKPADLPPK